MKFVRRIDRGGFGYVDEVETSDGSRVARKCFDPLVADPNERVTLQRRFEREVRIQSAIRHPNVMPVLEVSLAADPPWFTMPLATTSLELKLREDHASGAFDQRPWPDILGAVEELHRLGYVHRDLKPANILLVAGTWVVSDFGLILPTMRDTTVLTATALAYGSRNYAAPEQAVDFRNTPPQADIYALGCMLHDATEQAPVRIPFAQIRGSGRYGPLLEKCTEVDHRRRFPTVASLRAALFDLWSAASSPSGSLADDDVLAQLLATPASPELWRRLLQTLDGADPSQRDLLLRSINSDLILAVSSIDEVLLSRLMGHVCAWASSRSFDWNYCDVIGDRLLDAYRAAPVRLRVEIVLAALELAVSHNRWHVMHQVGGMLGTAADNGLVDRLIIEMGLDADIQYKLRRIETIIHWHRSHWHERIAKRLSEQEKA